MNNDQIRAVGGELGLSYSSLLRTTTLEDVVAAWLNRQDYVIQVSGQPTWHSLIKALRKQGQEGIASDIESEKSTV